MPEEKNNHPEHKYSVTFVSKVGTMNAGMEDLILTWSIWGGRGKDVNLIRLFLHELRVKLVLTLLFKMFKEVLISDMKKRSSFHDSTCMNNFKTALP